jgi:hypothetical protein
MPYRYANYLKSAIQSTIDNSFRTPIKQGKKTMKRILIISVFAFLCALAFVTGVQAQDQDPVGLAPTQGDASSIGKKPILSPTHR